MCFTSVTKIDNDGFLENMLNTWTRQNDELAEVFKQLMFIKTYLVGGFNPSEKYARQIGNLPQIGLKTKNIWNHHLVI